MLTMKSSSRRIYYPTWSENSSSTSRYRAGISRERLHPRLVPSATPTARSARRWRITLSSTCMTNRRQRMTQIKDNRTASYACHTFTPSGSWLPPRTQYFFLENLESPLHSSFIMSEGAHSTKENPESGIKDVHVRAIGGKIQRAC